MLEGDVEDEEDAAQFVCTGDLKVPGLGTRLFYCTINPDSVEVICQSRAAQNCLTVARDILRPNEPNAFSSRHTCQMHGQHVVC